MIIVLTYAPVLDEFLSTIEASLQLHLRTNAKYLTPCQFNRSCARLKRMFPSFPILLDLSGARLQLHLHDPRDRIHVDCGKDVEIALGQDETAPRRAFLHFVSPVSLNVGDLLIMHDGDTCLRVCCVKPPIFVACREAGAAPLSHGNSVVFRHSSAWFDSTLAWETHYVSGLMGSQIDGIILSFVEDVMRPRRFRKVVTDHASFGRRLPLWCKIETPNGVSNAAAISAEADAVIVGRGDLRASSSTDFRPAALAAVALARQRNPHVIVGTGLLADYMRTGNISHVDSRDIEELLTAGATGFMLTSELFSHPAPRKALDVLRSFL